MTIYFGDGTNQATAGGKILQVVSSFKNDTASTSGSSFVDTGVSASITPSSSSNKILIIWDINVSRSSGVGHLNLVRDSTAIAQPSGSESQSSSKQFYAQSHSTHRNISECYLDSPSTTSSITYKIQMRGEVGNSMTINGWYSGTNYRSGSNITLMEIG